MTITLHHRLREQLPGQKPYRMAPRQWPVMWGWKLGVAQLAAPVAAAIYFIWTQTQLTWSYPKGKTVLFSSYLGDAWDRLPVHAENLLHAHWFAGQAAPPWWVLARHDARYVLIGFLVIMITGAVTVGLKERKRASFPHMILSVPLAFLAAVAVAAPLIVLSVHLGPLGRLGVATGNPWLDNWIGKGHIQLLVIGGIAGMAARLVIARTQDTIQLMFLERRLLSQEEPLPWYPPNYVDRFSLLVQQRHQPPRHGKIANALISLFMSAISLSGLAGALLLAFGVWLLYFGFAAGAH